jgi:hypothetical protein
MMHKHNDDFKNNWELTRNEHVELVYVNGRKEVRNLFDLVFRILVGNVKLNQI